MIILCSHNSFEDPNRDPLPCRADHTWRASAGRVQGGLAYGGRAGDIGAATRNPGKVGTLCCGAGILYAACSGGARPAVTGNKVGAGHRCECSSVDMRLGAREYEK